MTIDTPRITAPTVERLNEELTRIVEYDLPAARLEVERAQGAGDIAENPDVRMALGEVARYEARVTQIRETLRYAEVIDAPALDRVSVGVLVTLRFDGDDTDETFLFASGEDRHGSYAVLTPGSPVGRVVDGARPGDEVVAPFGPVRVVAIAAP